jgi:transposase-like protein
MAAVTKDLNDRMVILAYAIVPTEDLESWRWFLSQLKSAHLTFSHSTYILVSDRDKGIAPAAESVLPQCTQLHCLKHLARNVRNSCKIQEEIVWKLAWSKSEEEYDALLRSLSEQSFRYFRNIDPETFADYAIPARFDFYTSNLAESFNNLIGNAREENVIGLVEFIHLILDDKVV